MRARQVLSLVVPATALALPTTTTSATSSSPADMMSPRSAVDTEEASSPSACQLVQLAESPTNAPACWAWFAETSEPSDYCGASTFSSVDIASASPSSDTDSDADTNWLDACTSMRNAALANTQDFFIAGYETDKFNTLLSGGGCSLQVKPVRPPSSDQIYVGGTDVTDLLGSAIGASQEGKVGVEGSMACGPDAMLWRMMPM